MTGLLMGGRGGVAAGMILLGLYGGLYGLSASPAMAERQTGTATRIENDRFGSSKVWGRDLIMPKDGTIIRVMDGTYGFQILDEEGVVVGDFLLPEQAIGFALKAGRYQLKPLVCRVHRHHHVEVTVDY